MGDVACRVPNYRSSSYPLGGSSLMTQINTWDIGFFFLSFFFMCKASVCASTWRPEDNLKCVLRNAVHFFGHSVSHCPGTHQLGKPGWLASLSDPSLSTSTALGLQAHTTTPDIFMWARGIRFRSTGLTSALLTKPFHCL